MKIVVLDGHTLNPGDLSWAPLAALGELAVHDRTAASLVVPRARGARVVLTNKTKISQAHLAELPGLKLVCILATGVNVIDLVSAKERGIVICNVPGYSTPSVAQTTFALLLELTNRVGLHSQDVKAGGWAHCPDFSYAKTSLIELAGLDIGIVGLGAIGQSVARIALSFGMSVSAHTRTPREMAGVKQVDLDTLFSRSDVVSLHCPLTEQTQRLVNAHRLSQMKLTALLINTSRGALVDEQALAHALEARTISGAALDVLECEPPPENHPLYALDNCVITPHYAWASRASRQRLLDITVENVKAFLAGKPVNVCSD